MKEKPLKARKKKILSKCFRQNLKKWNKIKREQSMNWRNIEIIGKSSTQII